MTELFPLNLLDDAVEFALKEVYLEELKASTPKKTGITAQSWGLKKVESFKYEIFNDKTTEDGQHTIVELLEEGTRPHTIVPKNKKSLKFEVKGKTIFAKKVEHPGFEARRFIQQTLDRKDLFQRFERFVWTHITRRI